MELELDYFEQIEASPALTLLRVAGAFSEDGPGADPPVLIVRSSGLEHRVPALGAAGGEGSENGAPWRAAFGVPTELVGTGTEYLLDVGREIPLPQPSARGQAEAAPVKDTDAAPAAETDAPPEAETVAPPEAETVAPPAPATLRREPVGEPEPILVTPASRAVPARDASVRRIVVVALVLVGLLGAWLAGAFSGSSSSPATTPAAATGTTPTAATPVALAPLPGLSAGARGRVTLRGSHLALRLQGLGAGTFQVWLYDSVLHSVPLGSPLKGPAPTLSVTLPAGSRAYRFIDVSREGDANPGHSGLSVLRVSLASLR